MADRNEVIKASNRVPKGTIRLRDAFELALRKMTPDWEDIKSRCTDWDASAPFEERMAHEVDPHVEEYEATHDAEIIFRDALRRGDLKAYICNPRTGRDEELDGREFRRGGTGRGFSSDYTSSVDPDNQGPDCKIDGVAQPIYLFLDNVMDWLRTELKVTSEIFLADPKVREIKHQLNSSPVLPLVCAYFLRTPRSLEPSLITKEADAAILTYLEDEFGRSTPVTRPTIRKARNMAKSILELTTAPELWTAMGVAEPPDTSDR